MTIIGLGVVCVVADVSSASIVSEGTGVAFETDVCDVVGADGEAAEIVVSEVVSEAEVVESMGSWATVVVESNVVGSKDEAAEVVPVTVVIMVLSAPPLSSRCPPR